MLKFVIYGNAHKTGQGGTDGAIYNVVGEKWDGRVIVLISCNFSCRTIKFVVYGLATYAQFYNNNCVPTIILWLSEEFWLLQNT